jgi:hypothetical protein
MPVGMATTYDLNVGTKVYIEDLIHGLDPADVPLLGGQGADGRSAIAKTSDLNVTKSEWLDESILTPRSTLAATITNVATSLTIPAADANKFGVGDVIAIDNELLRVTAVAADGFTLTVTRAFAGTTAAGHNSAAEVVGVGTALPEGSDPGVARTTDRTNRFNLTQIFGPHPVKVSNTENVIAKYGLRTTEFDHQGANRLKETFVSIEQAIMYGRRSDDPTNKIRTMGGLSYYITENVDSTTTDITAGAGSALLTLLETIWRQGGSPDRAVLSGFQKRKFGTISSDDIRLDRTDRGRGVMVDYFDSDFSRITLLMNRWARRSDLFVFERDQVELQTLRPVSFEMLAKTGDSIHGMIVGEKTLKVTRAKHAGRFSALT